MLDKQVSAADLEACALPNPLSAGFVKALAHLLPSLESALKEL